VAILSSVGTARRLRMAVRLTPLTYRKCRFCGDNLDISSVETAN
jgi:hypothetical protein